MNIKTKIVISFLILTIIGGGCFFARSKGITLGAAQKISDLTSYTTPQATDVLPINDTANATTKRIALSSLFTYITGTYPVINTAGVISLAFGTTTNNLWSGTNIFQNASTTIVGALTIGGNATATNATTTNFFATTASTTNLYIATGGCTGSNALNIVNGKVTCGAVATGLVTVKTMTTIPNFFNVAKNVVNIFGNGNTSLNCGEIQWPSSLTVSSFSVVAGTVAGRGGTAGQLKWGLYTETGASLVISTTTFISTTGLKTFALTSPVAVVPGNYYWCVVPVGTADIDLPSMTQNDSNLAPSGEPVQSGMATVSAGTLPSSITPISLTPGSNELVNVRFDD